MTLEELKAIKSHNLHDWIIGYIHLNFTQMADSMVMDGELNQTERILLSSCIGDSLSIMDAGMGEKLPQFKSRARWEQAPDDRSTGNAEDDNTSSTDSNTEDDPESLVTKTEQAVSESLQYSRGSVIKSVTAPLQFTDESEGKIGGWLVLYGSDNEKDLDNEWFSPKTKGMLDVFNHMGSLPWMYHHGADPDVKSSPVGTIVDIVPTDLGLWYEVQLDRANQFSSAVAKLVKDGVLGTSSGALPGSVKKAKTGHIDQWAIVEGSGTVSPRDPRQRSHPLSILSKATEYTPNVDAKAEDNRDDSPLSPEQHIAEKHIAELDLLEIEIDSF